MSRAFDGTQKMQGGNVPILGNGSTDTFTVTPVGKMTVAGWVYATSLAANPNGNRAISNWDGSKGWILLVNETGAKKLKFYVQTGALVSITGSTTIATGQWLHAAARYDGAHLDVFLGGAADATPVAQTGNISQPLGSGSTEDNHINLGQSEADTQRLVGKMADWAVWWDALTDAEILQLARGALPTAVHPENLVRWWRLFAGDATEPDSSGNFGNLTIVTATADRHPPIQSGYPARL